MADRFELLKSKYQSVLNFIQSQGLQLQNLNMEGDKLLIRASAPSSDLKNRVWDQIKLVDPSFSDLIADIQAPEAAAAATAAAGGATSTPAARTYTVQAGDNLSKISKQFYGEARRPGQSQSGDGSHHSSVAVISITHARKLSLCRALAK
jgi:nucleoid-associated protein YgaU